MQSRLSTYPWQRGYNRVLYLLWYDQAIESTHIRIGQNFLCSSKPLHLSSSYYCHINPLYCKKWQRFNV